MSLNQSFGLFNEQSYDEFLADSMNELQCFYCQELYDLQAKVSLIICSKKHHVCISCLRKIIKKCNKCPICQSTINRNIINKNTSVYNILEASAKQLGRKYTINKNPQNQFRPMITLTPPTIVPVGKPNVVVGNRPSPVITVNQPTVINVNKPAVAAVSSRKNKNPMRYQNRQPFRPRRNQGWCYKQHEALIWFNSIYVLILLTPFMVCDLMYGFQVGELDCMDKDYGVGMNLRTYLITSGFITLFMQTSQIITFLMCCCWKDAYNLFFNIITVMNIIFYYLKTWGYNVVGIVLYYNIDSNDRDLCDDSLNSYMLAFLIIQIVYFYIMSFPVVGLFCS